MFRKHSDALKRFISSAVIALPMTIALLFLMTQLILPGDRDPIVNRMIQDIEFRRSSTPLEIIRIPVFERPPKPKLEPLNVQEEIEASTAPTSEASVVEASEESMQQGPEYGVEWWAHQKAKLLDEAEDEALQRWLLEQGHEKYVSLMQGPVPITNSVRATLDATQEDITGYMNTFGDKEIKVSEACVLQTLVSARLDISDFAKNLPMRAMCKLNTPKKYSFNRD